MIPPVAPRPTHQAETPAAADQAKVRETAARFEAIILRQMLATMRQAKLAEDILGSKATDDFREMADARTADAIAASGAFGLARIIERQIGGKGAF